MKGNKKLSKQAGGKYYILFMKRF